MQTATPAFGGATFDDARDGSALTRQLDAVRAKMLGGGWFTLAEIAQTLCLSDGIIATEASVSARLRDLRKLKYGAYDIEKRVRQGTRRLWEYHLGTSRAEVPDFAHGKTRSETA